MNAAAEPVRIAMWSGPRNISTAMMRAFENRPDTAVIDEPFYGAYLTTTGLDHPLREAVLKSQPTDWRVAAAALLGPVPGGRRVFYQKHMTHHMVAEVGRDWMAGCRHAFLIRSPERVLASYAARRAKVSLADIGFTKQAELLDGEAKRLGAPPPVVDAEDVLGDPEGVLRALCDALGIDFLADMLRWPTGRRATDGVWAPAWYDAVERSTAFGPRRPVVVLEDLDESLKPIAAAARPHYERLARYRLSAGGAGASPRQLGKARD